MTVWAKIALWSCIAFPLWIVLSDALRSLGLPVPRLFGAALAWVAAGLLLAWALPLFHHHLGLPWAFAHP